MKFRDYINEVAVKFDKRFIKQVAKDQGHDITDGDAKQAHKIVSRRITSKEDYYYKLKEYFTV